MRYLPEPVLRDGVRRLLLSHGLSDDHALDVADTLIETSLDGVDTHGLRLLPTYIRELEGGRANPKPDFCIHGRYPAAALFDADHALGVVAANAAMREVIARASGCGIAALAVTNSNHFGAAAHYVRLATRHQQIGLVLSNSDALVVPFGGTKPLNGTNPLAMAAPALDGDAFVLDMATSQTSYSRVLHALSTDEPLDPSWVFAEEGSRPSATRLPPLLPLGGAKGQGLGMMIQILCALLANAPFDSELTNLYREPYDTPRRISHFMVAIEIAAFADPQQFQARLSQLLERFRSCQPAAGGKVTVAGDRERAIRRERLRNGIPVAPAEWGLLERFIDLSAPHVAAHNVALADS